LGHPGPAWPRCAKQSRRAPSSAACCQWVPHLTGKEAYDKAIDGAPEFIDPPELEMVRMVEEGDVVMAELSGRAKRAAGVTIAAAAVHLVAH
jgi:hypothetical protein